MTGGGLVALVVFVFLRRLGPTIIVAFSIPASMIVTFLVVYGMGYTLNSVTLIAMSLSVGMVVDNGVVALENISRKMADGLPPLKAAYEGASEVGGALWHRPRLFHFCAYDFHLWYRWADVCAAGCGHDCNGISLFVALTLTLPCRRVSERA